MGRCCGEDFGKGDKIETEEKVVSYLNKGYQLDDGSK